MQLGHRMKSMAYMPIGHIFDLEALHARLRAEKPDVIISTYPFATEILAYFKERGLLNAPTIWQHTDMVPREYFAKLAASMDRVCVAHESVASYFRTFFEKEGLPTDKVFTTGMPINLPPAYSTEEKRKLLIEQGFDPDIPLVVIEGGSNGVAPYKEIVQGLQEKSPVPVQVVAFCARNTDCKKELDTLKLNKDSNLKAFKAYGFFDTSDPNQSRTYFGLIESATADLTKPGGISPFERMARGVSLILHTVRTHLEEELTEADTPSKRAKILLFLKKTFGREPQPDELDEAFRVMSQEGYNAELLSKEGLAVLSTDAEDAVDKTIRLLTDASLRHEMSTRQHQFIQSMTLKPAINWIAGSLAEADWSVVHPPTFPLERCTWLLKQTLATELEHTAQIKKLRKTRKRAGK